MTETPIQVFTGVSVKRDDLFGTIPNQGGKVRGARPLFEHVRSAYSGVVAFGSRISTHIRVAAFTAREIGLDVAVVVPRRVQIVEDRATQLQHAGVEVIECIGNHLPDVIATARELAARRGWFLVPWGMKCSETIEAFRDEARRLPVVVDHVVVTCGTGTSLAGIHAGLLEAGNRAQIWGLCIGRNSRKIRIGLRNLATLPAGHVNLVNLGRYGARATTLPPFPSDPYYDARTWESIPSLDLSGDILFWNLGGDS